jgi:hypothetical protein
MAAANLTTHLPILQVLEKAGTTPFTSSQPEAAGETFLSGTPVQLGGKAAGYVQAWDGTTVTAGILGISESFGLNLTTAGLGAPVAPFGGITGNIAIQTYGSVVNQPSGVNIALGTPVSDGRTLYMEPNQDNIFQALYDNSIGTTTANWTTTQATVGAVLGLTKDANGYWYVDGGKTGAAACVQVVGLPMGPGLNSLVNFVFLATAIQVA